MSLFRPYSRSDSLRSDRSAVDRLRHRQKVRDAIRKNIADIVAEESIIGQSGDKVVKVPIRGMKEYRFVYGENQPGVGTGQGQSKPGQVVGKAGQQGQAPGVGPQAGDQPGQDVYETDITLDELVDIVFEDLELPDLERKHLRDALSERTSKRKGFKKQGIRVHLDKRRTALARIRRKVASGRELAEGERFPFHADDMKFHRMVEDLRPQSNAVVFCIMDTSGSMDTAKKYLARSFFFLLYQFVKARYTRVEVVFVAHHTEGKEVTQEEFFHKGESGGTAISSGYNKALELIQERYHPSLWNIYAFHCSDGDNWADDNAAAIKAGEKLCEVGNLFGYAEIKPGTQMAYESSMLEQFKKLTAPNFQTCLIQRKEDIWPNFKALLGKERIKEAAGS